MCVYIYIYIYIYIYSVFVCVCVLFNMYTFKCCVNVLILLCVYVYVFLFSCNGLRYHMSKTRCEDHADGQLEKKAKTGASFLVLLYSVHCHT